MPNQWVNWVKQFSKDNNLSYACALSTPACKEIYRAKYGFSKKLSKKDNIKKMGAEDINVAEKPNIQIVVKEKKKRRPTLKLEEVMMEAEDNRSKMVATQEKKKKVLASLPKPKTVSEEPKPKKITVKRLIVNGVEYLKDGNNILYDSKTKEEIGIWNPETKTIEEFDDEEDDEEDVGEFSELEFTKWMNEKMKLGDGWDGIKDKFGNWFAYHISPYKLTKLVRPNGEILDFSKDELDLTKEEDKLYTKIFMVMNRERENYKGKDITSNPAQKSRLLKYIFKTIK